MGTRRDFLKGVLAGSAAATAGAVATPVLARETRPRPPEALGLLYDSTLCVGCKACVAACKAANENPPEFSTADHLWDTPLDTSGYTFNLIKMYRNGTMDAKDQETNGFAFMKTSCMSATTRTSALAAATALPPAPSAFPSTSTIRPPAASASASCAATATRTAITRPAPRSARPAPCCSARLRSCLKRPSAGWP